MKELLAAVNVVNGLVLWCCRNFLRNAIFVSRAFFGCGCTELIFVDFYALFNKLLSARICYLTYERE
jgi:hypothetical protein